MTKNERTFALAGRVRAALEQRRVGSAVIGAMALAAHGYPRGTEDFDLATWTDPFTVLRAVAQELAAGGLEVELREPDADDPLGGVLDVRGPDADLVQVVNFRDRLAREAIQSAISLPGVPFPVVDLVHLVALKLDAGGPLDIADAIEVLKRNSPPPLDELRQVCSRHELSAKLERILSAL
ncbi:MAG TPA: hypothetical protein VND93_04975 [Myxococcales bacterium]|jgi:hypothetical protein|nr:hypothetical protein [Myxococcales bacterium]